MLATAYKFTGISSKGRQARKRHIPNIPVTVHIHPLPHVHTPPCSSRQRGGLATCDADQTSSWNESTSFGTGCGSRSPCREHQKSKQFSRSSQYTRRRSASRQRCTVRRKWHNYVLVLQAFTKRGDLRDFLTIPSRCFHPSQVAHVMGHCSAVFWAAAVRWPEAVQYWDLPRGKPLKATVVPGLPLVLSPQT